MPQLIVNRKCGDIMITIRKNSKKVFTYSCSFCDTVFLQMKKFTSHLDREHDKQLKLINKTIPDKNKYDEKDISENLIVKQNSINSIYIPEIKMEDCLDEEIKTEIIEEARITRQTVKKESSFASADPLDTYQNEIFGKDVTIAAKKEAENSEKTVIKTKFKTTKYVADDAGKKNDVNLSKHIIENIDDNQSNDNSDNHSDIENPKSSDFEPEGGETCATKRSRKRKISKENLDDHRIISALIDLFKPHEFLWNSQHSESRNIVLRRDILQNITDELNTKFKTHLKMEIIRKKINILRRDYTLEVEKRMDRMLEREETSNLWYYDKMEFLKPSIEYKIKNRSKLNSFKVKALSESLLSQLTDIYKDFNTLWDGNHLAFIIKEKRLESLEGLQREVKEKMNLDLSIFRLEKQLTYIHKAYSKDKRRQLECEIQKTQKEFKPTCEYFNKCDFLAFSQGPFRCTTCQEIIETYNEFQIHKSQHDNSTPFKCPECGLGFKKTNNYKLHVRRHLNAFKYRCNICDKGYPLAGELDLHMRYHTGAMPYLCSKCGEAFRTATAYDNHIRRHEKRFRYFCHICKKGINLMSQLKDHVKTHLNVRDVICPVCGKGFATFKYMNHHKRIHEAKRYTCDICGKKFAQDAGLRAHKKSHKRHSFIVSNSLVA
uniref:Protein krueppel n=1 Tax=Glossina brevipalpis TaxID=37001 RepID=A0A1A9WIN2_9MUSC